MRKKEQGENNTKGEGINGDDKKKRNESTANRIGIENRIIDAANRIGGANRIDAANQIAVANQIDAANQINALESNQLAANRI